MTAPTAKVSKSRERLPTKGEQRQAEIVSAARRLLVDDGYDCFVLREVAARLDMTIGNLQYYYATRDDLLEAVIHAEFARNQQEIARLSATRLEPVGKLEAIVRHLVHVWAKDGGRVYVVMSLLAIHHERFGDLHREIYAAFYDGLAPVLAELQPKLRPSELRRRARLVTALVDGALVQVPGPGFMADTVAAAIRIASS